MRKNGQALTELAVFGAIILLLLGYVVIHGLDQNYQQQVTQHAFRRAMGHALGRLGGVSYTLIHDRHTPDPMDTHGVGSIGSSTSSSYVMRDYRMYQAGVLSLELEDLPRMYIGVGSGFTVREVGPGGREYFYAAGLQDYCWGDPCERFADEKYEEIFGESNVEVYPDADCVRVMDYCEGEIISYGTCRRQCRMFTDLDYCIEQCRMGSLSGARCGDICAADVPVPAYCGVLDSLFGFARTPDMRTMGVQPETTRIRTRGDTMNKTESPAGIATTDALGSGQTVIRRIIYKPMGSVSWGELADAADTAIEGSIEMDAEW